MTINGSFIMNTEQQLKRHEGIMTYRKTIYPILFNWVFTLLNLFRFSKQVLASLPGFPLKTYGNDDLTEFFTTGHVIPAFSQRESSFITLTAYPILFILIFLPTLCFAENSSLLIEQAKSYSVKGKHTKAYETYWQAFKENPDDINLNFQLGMAAVNIKDYEAAVMAFERVLIASPNAVQAKIEIAKAFYRLGSVETAREYFTEALEADIPQQVRANIEKFLAAIP